MLRIFLVFMFVFVIGIGISQAQDISYDADDLPTTGTTQITINLGQGYGLFYVADNGAGSIHLIGSGQGTSVAFDSTNLESIAVSEIRRGEAPEVSTIAFEIVIYREAFSGQGFDLGDLDFGFSMDTLSQLGGILSSVADGIVNTLASQDIHCHALVVTITMPDQSQMNNASLACTTVV